MKLLRLNLVLLFSFQCLDVGCGDSLYSPDIGLWPGFHDYGFRPTLVRLSLLVQLSARRRTDISDSRTESRPGRQLSRSRPEDLFIPLREETSTFVLSRFPAILGPRLRI